jgi:multiple sugar transport system substrate-binding protein
MIQRSLTRRSYILSMVLILSILVGLLSACSSGGKQNSDERRTLRIGTLYGSKDDESNFRQQFTDLFEYSNPNVDIEIVPAIDYNDMRFSSGEEQRRQQPDPLERAKAIMTGSNPVDVMILGTDIMGQLAADNQLVQLDSLIKEDKLDLEGIVPAVLDSIRAEGDGKIYGLSPTFSSGVLFYNKKLFQKAGVDFPKDGMSWDDVFTLAKRLKSGSGDTAQFGLTLNPYGGSSGFWAINEYAMPLKLRMFDENAEKMTVNSDKWRKIWTDIDALSKDHVMPSTEDTQWREPAQGEPYNPYQGQLFLMGRAAMTVGYYGTVNDLMGANARADKVKGAEKIDWDVVTMPSHSELPGVSGNFYVSQLATINAQAKNKDDAWEFVKFMNSKDWAKLKSRSTYEMSVYKEFIKPREGMNYNAAAFYNVKPIQNSMSRKDQELFRTRPNLSLVQELADLLYNKVQQGQMTVDEALKQWESRGNDLLQKIKLSPVKEIPGVFDDLQGGPGGDSRSGTAQAVPVG